MCWRSGRAELAAVSLARFYYDTAQSRYRANAGLKTIVGIGQIVLVAIIRLARGWGSISSVCKRRIHGRRTKADPRENALKILPRFKANIFRFDFKF